MGRTGNTDASATNPYTLAYRREGGGRRTQDASDIPAKVLLCPVTCTRNVISGRQAQKLQRLRLTASWAALAQSEALEWGSAAFIARNTPTVGDLASLLNLVLLSGKGQFGIRSQILAHWYLLEQTW
jgi:hypothetical protein